MSLNCTTDRQRDDLLEHQAWPPLTLDPSEPVENARRFCKHRRLPLVYWRGDFYYWVGTRYQQRTEDAIRAEVYSFLDSAKVETKLGKAPFRPDSANVREVLSALKCLEGRTFVPESVDAPCWLRGRGNKPNPQNLIALENVILDLETGASLPHSSDFFTMTALPFEYD